MLPPWAKRLESATSSPAVKSGHVEIALVIRCRDEVLMASRQDRAEGCLRSAHLASPTMSTRSNLGRFAGDKLLIDEIHDPV